MPPCPKCGQSCIEVAAHAEDEPVYFRCETCQINFRFTKEGGLTFWMYSENPSDVEAWPHWKEIHKWGKARYGEIPFERGKVLTATFKATAAVIPN